MAKRKLTKKEKKIASKFSKKKSEDLTEEEKKKIRPFARERAKKAAQGSNPVAKAVLNKAGRMALKKNPEKAGVKVDQFTDLPKDKLDSGLVAATPHLEKIMSDAEKGKGFNIAMRAALRFKSRQGLKEFKEEELRGKSKKQGKAKAEKQGKGKAKAKKGTQNKRGKKETGNYVDNIRKNQKKQ